MENKKISSTKPKKSTPRRIYLRRKKRANFSQYIPSLIVASFIVIFLLWRILVLIPKVRENNHDYYKQTTANVEKSEAKSIKKHNKKKEIAKQENIKVEPKREEIEKSSQKEGGQDSKLNNNDLRKKAEKKEKAPSLPENKIAFSEETEQQPKCAIVIDDVGSSIELLNYAVKVLPKTTSFAIIPFQKYSKESAEILHREGFHIMLHSPMEAEEKDISYNTPYVIRSSMTKKEVRQALEKQIEEVPYAEGMNNHTGSKATKDPDLMRSVMLFSKERGLFFLDSRTTPLTVAYKIAIEQGVRAAERKIFIDNDNRDSAIILKVDELALLAKKDKKAVAIGHLRSNTIKILESRIPYWQKRGVKFISLSDIIKENGKGS